MLIVMNQDLQKLVDRLTNEIFHKERYNAAPSMDRIKATMAAVNKYTGKNDLTNKTKDSGRCDKCGALTWPDGKEFDYTP